MISNGVYVRIGQRFRARVTVISSLYRTQAGYMSSKKEKKEKKRQDTKERCFMFVTIIRLRASPIKGEVISGCNEEGCKHPHNQEPCS
jgi:hypothetical protein